MSNLNSDDFVDAVKVGDDVQTNLRTLVFQLAQEQRQQVLDRAKKDKNCLLFILILRERSKNEVKFVLKWIKNKPYLLLKITYLLFKSLFWEYRQQVPPVHNLTKIAKCLRNFEKNQAEITFLIWVKYC